MCIHISFCAFAQAGTYLLKHHQKGFSGLASELVGYLLPRSRPRMDLLAAENNTPHRAKYRAISGAVEGRDRSGLLSGLMSI